MYPLVANLTQLQLSWLIRHAVGVEEGSDLVLAIDRKSSRAILRDF